MNLCSSGHDEVCYENHSCPVCDLISDKNSTIENLEGQIAEFKQLLEESQSENERLIHGQSDGER